MKPFSRVQTSNDREWEGDAGGLCVEHKENNLRCHRIDSSYRTWSRPLNAGKKWRAQGVLRQFLPRTA